MRRREQQARVCQLMCGRDAVRRVAGYRLCQPHLDRLQEIVDERPDRCHHRDTKGRCTEGSAATAYNDCPKYCGAHCKAHRNDHDCRRGRKRAYMRDFMAKRYRASCEQTKQLPAIAEVAA